MKEASNYHHGNLREALLRAGLSLLDQDGIAAVGIRQIAKKVGVAHSAPANHFKNKHSLLSALNHLIVRHLIKTVRNEMQVESKTGEEPIQQFSRIVLDYGLKYPNRYRLVWQSEFELDDAMDEIYQILVEMLSVYAKEKHVDVESQAIALWSLIHGYVTLRLDGHLERGEDDVTGLNRQHAIIDVILEGIK